MKKPALEDKTLLTLGEAVELWGLNQKKFKRFREEESDLPFLISYSKRKMVIREEFEKYLARPGVKERLTNGKRWI